MTDLKAFLLAHHPDWLKRKSWRVMAETMSLSDLDGLFESPGQVVIPQNIAELIHGSPTQDH